jgi:hypothetical protein
MVAKMMSLMYPSSLDNTVEAISRPVALATAAFPLSSTIAPANTVYSEVLAPLRSSAPVNGFPLYSNKIPMPCRLPQK